MNLGKHVYNLLKRQPEVYVAGLGSFRRNHTSATYDEKRNVYLPPITYIDFDWTGNQGYDFIQYIQQLQRIDRAEAEQVVASQVADLLHRVKEDGQVKLDDLGHLVSYGEGYVFKALDLTGFQYEPVEAITPPQPIEEETVPESEAVQPGEDDATTVEEKTVSEEEEQEDTPVVAEVEQLVPVEEEELVEEEEAPRSGSNAIWYVVIALIALGIIAALYYVNQNQEPIAQLPGASAVVDSNAHAHEPDTTASFVASDSIPGADSLGQALLDTAQTSAAINKPLIPEHHTWQIVIGSHKTLAQAYEQAESYNKAGFPKVRVIPSHMARNRKKVIWDSYETKQEADSALRYVRKHHIGDAWTDEIK